MVKISGNTCSDQGIRSKHNVHYVLSYVGGLNKPLSGLPLASTFGE